jgi:hypothetical protein
MKREIRILLVHESKCGFSLYAIIRGIKGIEHLALVRGGFNEALEDARIKDLLDEVRHVINLDSEIELSSITDSQLLKVIHYTKELLLNTENEIVRLIGCG